MPDRLVTLDTFPNPERARFIQGLLESEGAPASLADEAEGGMMWHLNNAIGGIKVQVTKPTFPALKRFSRPTARSAWPSAPGDSRCARQARRRRRRRRCR